MSKKTIIYYSGEGHTWSNPECCLGEAANLMLTFHNSYNKKRLDARFRAVLRGRKRRSKERKTA